MAAAITITLPGGGTFTLGGGLDSVMQDIYAFLRYIVPTISKEPGERGRVFQAVLTQINEIASGNISLDDFLYNVSEFFPSGFADDRFIEIGEKAQYNGFLGAFEELLNSEDPASASEGFFERYENAGIANNSIILGELDSFGGINSFSLMNPQNILDRAILGDGDIGVTVQMCTTTVTTNCVTLEQ